MPELWPLLRNGNQGIIQESELGGVLQITGGVWVGVASGASKKIFSHPP